jgi:acyl-CoA thioester hydrolase
MRIKIYYEDTDAGGVVYYANYLNYFERARTEYFEQKGINIKALKDKGIQFVVVRAEVDYKSPAQYADQIDIDVIVKNRSQASFELGYDVKNINTGKIVVTGSTKMACIGKDFKPIRIPPEISEKI